MSDDYVTVAHLAWRYRLPNSITRRLRRHLTEWRACESNIRGGGFFPWTVAAAFLRDEGVDPKRDLFRCSCGRWFQEAGQRDAHEAACGVQP